MSEGRIAYLGPTSDMCDFFLKYVWLKDIHVDCCTSCHTLLNSKHETAHNNRLRALWHMWLTALNMWELCMYVPTLYLNQQMLNHITS